MQGVQVSRKKHLGPGLLNPLAGPKPSLARIPVKVPVMLDRHTRASTRGGGRTTGAPLKIDGQTDLRLQDLFSPGTSHGVDKTATLSSHPSEESSSGGGKTVCDEGHRVPGKDTRRRGAPRLASEQSTFLSRSLVVVRTSHHDAKVVSRTRSVGLNLPGNLRRKKKISEVVESLVSWNAKVPRRGSPVGPKIS